MNSRNMNQAFWKPECYYRKKRKGKTRDEFQKYESGMQEGRDE